MSFLMEIYLDNAASAKPYPAVVSLMTEMLQTYYGNPSSAHALGKQAAELLAEQRKRFANIIGSASDEIIFTSGATEADTLAIVGVAESLFYKTRGKKNQLIVSSVEHSCILRCCEHLKKKGFVVTHLPVDTHGIVNSKFLEQQISNRTALVSVQTVNNETGVIQDIAKIATLCKKKEALVHTDHVQGFTKIPFSVATVPVDMASFSGHKIHGPKGVGALFLRKQTPLFPLFSGHQEHGLRGGTENLAGIIGFVKAAELSVKADYKAVARLRDGLVKEITSSISDSFLIGCLENLAPHIANIFFHGVDSEALLQHLNASGIFVSTASACQQQRIEHSHVLTAMHLPEVGANIRFSLSLFTTRKEIEETVKHVKMVVASLRNVG